MYGSTIYLAGGEVETLTRALVDNGVKWILYSFYYILDFRREAFITQLQRERPDIKWFLDSGAFTYAKQSARRSDLPKPEEYVQKYFKFIDKYGHLWTRIAEPDLDGIEELPDISVDRVTEWREEMLTRWPELPIMPCWHFWRGKRAWLDYCADPRIKCLSFGRSSGNEATLRWLVMQAREVEKPVHGFGYTKIKTTLKQSVFCDSVDSTSWLAGQKYGVLYVFRNNTMTSLDMFHKLERRQFRSHFTRIGIDWRKIEKDDVAELRKANIIAWRDLANVFNVLKEQRDYLLKNYGGKLPPLISNDMPDRKPTIPPKKRIKK